MAITVVAEVAELKEELIATRRDLHRHPETAFQERRTGNLVADRLASFGYSVQRDIAETGVVGILEGDIPGGPTVMIRADIDALPIQEVEGRAYSSLSPGTMHACGHDGHTSVGLAVAEILSRYKGNIKGKVKLVFQPAEEIIAGAKRMVEEGVMSDPNVDKVLAFHMWPSLPVGKVVAQGGPIFSSVDEINIEIKGKGGHGGLPHLSVDPVVIASHVVLALQGLMSREIAPQPAVLGFGIIRGGSQFNIIAEQVELTGNVRTFDENNRAFMLGRIQEISSMVASALRGEAVFHHVKGSPSVVNDLDVARTVAGVASDVVGTENVITIPPATVGDDAAYFLNEAPGCYFLMGCANLNRGIVAPLHSPEFDIDEEVLPLATRILAESALRYLT